jgi:hypothetical protein
MRVLFWVFILSLTALIWTLMALRSYIRNHDRQTGNPLQLTGAQPEDSLKQND